MGKICLYLDEDASRASFIKALRSNSIDILTTAEVGNLGLVDSEQLIWATTNNRVIYTFNVKDYSYLHKIYMAAGKEQAGIIAAPRQSYSVGEHN